MADTTKQRRTHRRMKIGRVRIGLNVVVQIVLVLFLAAMVNSYAFKHYKRSIELNPRHRGAHEYIGEAYLMVDDLASAEKHLAALRDICLLPCDELGDLEKAIAQYRARAGAKR